MIAGDVGTLPPPVFLDSRRCRKSCSFLLCSFIRLQHPWSWLMSRLIPFEFWELNFFRISSQAFAFFVYVLLSYPLFSISGFSLPNHANKSFSRSSLLKLVVRPVLEPILSKTSNFKMIYYTIINLALDQNIQPPMLFFSWPRRYKDQLIMAPTLVESS